MGEKTNKVFYHTVCACERVCVCVRLTGVVEGHFLLDHTAALFHLSAQLGLAAPQLLLAAQSQWKQSERTEPTIDLEWVRKQTYHSSVLSLHSLASLSRVCAFTCQEQSKCITMLILLSLSLPPPLPPAPLSVLCHSAASL